MMDSATPSQLGNNNAFCQDNEISCFDSTVLEKHGYIHRFVKMLNARRVLRGKEPERSRMSLNDLLRQARKEWHGVKLNHPDWGEQSHSLALTFENRWEKMLLHVIFNAYWEQMD